MHHYRFHIKDYISATAHLSNDEDLAYRRLLDMYYDTEQQIPLETNPVSRRLRIGSEVLQYVLSEYFIRTETGWSHARCDAEIGAYHAKSEQAKINGKAGGRPKKTKREANGNRIGSEKKADRKLTNNQEPIVNPLPPEAQTKFDRFWLAYPKRVGKGAAEKAFAKANINGHFEDVLVALERQKLSDQWQKDNGQFIPNPATWLNQKRWEDEVAGGSAASFTPVNLL